MAKRQEKRSLWNAVCARFFIVLEAFLAWSCFTFIVVFSLNWGMAILVNWWKAISLGMAAIILTQFDALLSTLLLTSPSSWARIYPLLTPYFAVEEREEKRKAILGWLKGSVWALLIGVSGGLLTWTSGYPTVSKLMKWIPWVLGGLSGVIKATRWCKKPGSA